MKTSAAEQAKNLPQVPGIYKFKNAKKELLYIGKAKNLKNRVGSYFQGGIDQNSKTALLVQEIASIEFIEVKSEVEALILEAQLIGKYKPFYNIVLKDDKSFLYIEILLEKVILDSKKVLLPGLKVSRKGDLQKSSSVFGPFPSSSATRFVLHTLRKYFPYRDCSRSKFSACAKIARPCLYGDLHLCSAPCIKRISPEKYRRQIHGIKDFLNGKASKLISSLEKKMRTASKYQKYEDAQEYRDMIQRFNYVREKRIPAELYAQKPDLIQDLAFLALTQLQEFLPNIITFPTRIECYDISDISGKDAVGSMVVAIDGKLRKDLYRRFKIKTQNLPDDATRMGEVLFRRLKKGLENQENWELPDLLVLDGGSSQLSFAQKILGKTNLDYIPIIGLTKKEEILIYFDGTRYVEIPLPQNIEALKLLIRLRDEAHRFAQAYHHKLRLSKIINQ